MSASLPQLSAINLPWPTDWGKVFGQSRPLSLEIGFGLGHYLEHLHITRPEHNIVGLEISGFCMTKAERAIRRKRMENVRVVMARAETALRHLFTPESLDEIHINYPDPWFKVRHAGRRVMQRVTLDAMASRMKPGAMLYLATDILEYAEMSAEILEAAPALDNTLPTPWTDHMDGRIVTKYEKKARNEGRRSYYFAYLRNRNPAPDLPVIKELDMPHMVIHTPLSIDEIYEKMVVDPETTDFSAGETRINVIRRYRDDSSLLFEIYVHELTIEQRVGVVVAPRPQSGEYTIKLSGLGNPRPTEGLHHAVGLITDQITALHPNTRMIHDKVKRQP